MIIIDTHIWVSWALDLPDLREAQVQAIREEVNDRVGLCTFSCWEVAKLVQLGRLRTPIGLSGWFDYSLNLPGLDLVDMTPEIAIEANQLPGDFHRDPADQIIVANARINRCPLVTSDRKIRQYPHVQIVY